MQKSLSSYIKRFVYILIASILFVGFVNESTHNILKEKTDRPPKTIKIIIPEGTSDRVEKGEFVPTIPTEFTFVIGDTLEVHNQDNVPHELGPLFIPVGTSASLRIEDANKYALGCTFQPSKYLDIDVRTRTTAATRLKAFGIAAPPMAMFLFVYSLILVPIKNKSEIPEILASQDKNDVP